MSGGSPRSVGGSNFGLPRVAFAVASASLTTARPYTCCESQLSDFSSSSPSWLLSGPCGLQHTGDVVYLHCFDRSPAGSSSKPWLQDQRIQPSGNPPETGQTFFVGILLCSTSRKMSMAKMSMAGLFFFDAKAHRLNTCTNQPYS